MTKQDKANPRVKTRRCEAFGRQSPPFAERREGWGTLKFSCGMALEDKPKREKSGEERSGLLIVRAHPSLKGAKDGAPFEAQGKPSSSVVEWR
jgi:hypothetical protein